MNNHTGAERRRFKRVKIGVTVFYHEKEAPKVRVRSEKGENQALMIDIGEGGMSILTDVAIRPATALWVRFTLIYPENKAVNFYGDMELLGEVRYCITQENNLYRLGIAFTSIDDRIRQNLLDFIDMVVKHLEYKE